MPSGNHKRLAQGFTLVEALVALAVITIISLLIMGAVGPWLGLKQNIDTERKLQDIKQGLVAYYNLNGMEIEARGGGQFGPFTSGCGDQTAAFQELGTLFSESSAQIAKDGYMTHWCFFISSPLSRIVDGVEMWYRNVAVVSPGPDVTLDPGTLMGAEGALVLEGDDKGILLTGLDIHAPKLKETMKRMNRLATMYETYFTSRFMAYGDRDITRYYFSRAYDPGGAIESTGGSWRAAAVLFAGAVSPTDAVTPYERDNAIEVGNHTESVGPLSVRSPASTGTGALPYTAILRARLPAPAGVDAFATHVVIGNY